MVEPALPVATVRTLLLTDVVDSTRLVEELGDAAMAIGYMQFHLGAPAAARPYFEQAWTIHGEFGFTYGQAIWSWGLARLEADAGSDRWRSFIEDAVRLSAPYALLHAEALAVRAQLRVRVGETESARGDVEAARALRQKGRVAVVVALADAYVAHAEGRVDAVSAALQEAERGTAEAHLGALSPTGRELAAARTLVQGADAGVTRP